MTGSRSLLASIGGIGLLLMAGAAAACGQPCVAEWSSRLNPGDVSGSVTTLVAAATNTGPVLYAAGTLVQIGGMPAQGVACWDGSRWSPLGGANSGAPNNVRALAISDAGSSPVLYAGGEDYSPEGPHYLTFWNGTA